MWWHWFRTINDKNREKWTTAVTFLGSEILINSLSHHIVMILRAHDISHLLSISIKRRVRGHTTRLISISCATITILFMVMKPGSSFSCRRNVQCVCVWEGKGEGGAVYEYTLMQSFVIFDYVRSFYSLNIHSSKEFSVIGNFIL